MNAWFFLLLIPSLVQIVLRLIRADSPEEYGKTVKANPICLSIGISLLGLSVLAIVLNRLVWDEIALIIIAGVFAVLSVVFLQHTTYLTISYDQSCFTVKKYLHKGVQYSYTDIDAVVLNRDSACKLICGKHSYYIDELMSGRREFLEYVDAQYTARIGCSVPIRENRLFNGYVLNPGEILFGFLIVPILISGIFAFAMIRDAKRQEIPDPLYQKCIEVTDISNIGFSYRISTDLGNCYIPKDAIADTGLIKGRFTVDVSPINDTEYEIWSMSSNDGTIHIGVDTIMAADVNTSARVSRWAAAVVVLFWLMFAWICYVLGHAPRYFKLASLLIKSGYRNF